MSWLMEAFGCPLPENHVGEMRAPGILSSLNGQQPYPNLLRRLGVRAEGFFAVNDTGALLAGFLRSPLRQARAASSCARSDHLGHAQ